MLSVKNWQEGLIIFGFLALAVIHLLPLMGLFSVGKMERAYGVVLQSDHLQILMRHRALLFGLLGGFALFAAFVTVYRWPALMMLTISMLGFIVVAGLSEGGIGPLKSVVKADWLGCGIALLLFVLQIFRN